MLSITLGRQGWVLHVGVAHAVQGLEKVLRFEQQGFLHAFTPCARGCRVFRPYVFARVRKPVLLLCVQCFEYHCFQFGFVGGRGSER